MKLMVLLLLLPILCCDVFARAEKGRAAESDQVALDKFTELKSKAEQGDAESQCLLGLHYRRAKGPTEAATWFLRAANQGWAQVQFELGLLCADPFDRGLPQDEKAST